jgi:hypothetical protein
MSRRDGSRAVVITKHGKAVVKLVPANGGEDEILGALAGNRPNYGRYREHRSGQRLGSGVILLDIHILIWLLLHESEMVSPLGG